MAWDFGIDVFHSERAVNRVSGDPIDLVVNGDIDWVRLAPAAPFRKYSKGIMLTYM